MKAIFLGIACLLGFATYMTVKSTNEVKPTIMQEEASAIATEAYIYGYPLVTMEMTRRVMTNVAIPTGLRAPMGQFAHSRNFVDASYHDVTAPNTDVLYSMAWLDVGKEPYVLSVPEQGDGYYLMPMISGWSDVFADIGTRTTGNGAGSFVITGPHFSGKIPQGLKELKSPTNMVWVLGRTFVPSVSKEALSKVHAIQDKYTLIPLSYLGKPYVAKIGSVDPKIDMKTPVKDQVNRLDGEEYFSLLAKLLKDNPPVLEDNLMVKRLAILGIDKEKDFDIKKLQSCVVDAINEAPKNGQDMIFSFENPATKIMNGWQFFTEVGRYGTHYLHRGYVASVGFGMNVPQDALYPITHVDSQGRPLIGEKRYVVHFSSVPPVRGFWSLTMYNSAYFFVENQIKKYSINSRDALKYNADGSLDLYIQNESPGKDKESNWLPAPSQGKFILMLRFYWPEKSIEDGSWVLPSVNPVE